MSMSRPFSPRATEDSDLNVGLSIFLFPPARGIVSLRMFLGAAQRCSEMLSNCLMSGGGAQRTVLASSFTQPQATCTSAGEGGTQVLNGYCLVKI